MIFPFVKKFDFHLREIIHGTSIAFAFRVLGAILAMAFQIAMARVLGAHDMGLYVLCVSCVLFVSLIGRMGLDTIVVRQIASHVSVGEWKSVLSIRRKTLRFVFAATCALSGLLIFFADWISQDLFKDITMTFPLSLMAAAAPFWAVAALQSEMLRGLKKVGQYLFIQSVMMALITLVGVFVVGVKWGLNGQTVVYVFASVLAMVTALTMWRWSRPHTIEGGGDVPLQDLFKASMPMLWVACIQYVNTWIATVILGTYGEPAEVAIFNSASRLALAPGFLLISVNSILGPKFAAIHKTGTREELQRVASQTTRLLFFAVLPVFVVFLIWPKWILGLFGPEFQVAEWVLRVLVLGQMTLFMTGFAGQLLLMTGHEKDLRNITTFSVVLNIAGSWLLIRSFGMHGAGYVVLAATALTAGLNVWSVKKRLGIQAHIFSGLLRSVA